MAKLIHVSYCVLIAVILCAPRAWAQGPDAAKPEPGVQPVAPYQPPLAAGSTSILALNPNSDIPVAGDNRPLSGVQDQTLGTNLGARNVLAPSFTAASEMGAGSTASGFSQPSAFYLLLATLDLNHASDRSELLVHYTGGGMFSSYLNSAVQELQFTYNFKW